MISYNAVMAKAARAAKRKAEKMMMVDTTEIISPSTPQ
jgi:hypothetical protein